MEDDITMMVSMEALEGYLNVLNTLRSLNWVDKETTINYDEVVGLVSDRLKEIKGAFASREFLRTYCDYDITDERIEEFEDFLEGRKKSLSGLEGEITRAATQFYALNKSN